MDPSYRSNPYVVDAGLADIERWPELSMPRSPTPSDDEAGPTRHGGRPSGFPGATGLKYTTTILGPSRSGALGLRVTGKRQPPPTSSRASMRRSVSQPRPINIASSPGADNDVTPEMPASASPRKADMSRKSDIEITINDVFSDSKVPAPSTIITSDAPENAPSAPMLMFVPKFKGAAEMEARRRQRMRNRLPPGGAPIRPQLSAPANLNPELSSSSSSSSSPSSSMSLSASLEEEEQDVLPNDDDEFDDDVDEEDMVDDDFNP